MEFLLVMIIVVAIPVAIAFLALKHDAFTYYDKWYDSGVEDRRRDDHYGRGKFFYFGSNLLARDERFMSEPYEDGYAGRPRRTSWLFKSKREGDK